MKLVVRVNTSEIYETKEHYIGLAQGVRVDLVQLTWYFIFFVKKRSHIV